MISVYNLYPVCSADTCWKLRDSRGLGTIVLLDDKEVALEIWERANRYVVLLLKCEILACFGFQNINCWMYSLIQLCSGPINVGQIGKIWWLVAGGMTKGYP